MATRKMNILCMITAKILIIGYNLIPSLGFSLIFLVFISKICFLFAGKNYYYSIKSKEVLAPLLAESKKRHGKDSEDKGLTEILIKNRYPLFGGISNFLTQCVFALGTWGVFTKPDLYISGVPQHFLGINMSLVTFEAMLSRSEQSVPALLLITLVLALFVIHDRIMQSTALVNYSPIHIITWILILVGCLFLNMAFVMYWIFMMLFNLINIFAVKKFYKASGRITPQKERKGLRYEKQHR